MKIFFFPCGTGVRCQNRTRFALATIDERGAKRLKTGRVKNKVVLWNVPIFRGISAFFLGLAAFFTAYWEGLNLSGVTLNGGVSEKVAGKLNVKKEGVVITILLLLSLAASLFLFGFCVTKLVVVLHKRAIKSKWSKNGFYKTVISDCLMFHWKQIQV